MNKKCSETCMIDFYQPNTSRGQSKSTQAPQSRKVSMMFDFSFLLFLSFFTNLNYSSSSLLASAIAQVANNVFTSGSNRLDIIVYGTEF
jgi:uncharacterized membrane-anchored protein YitT (DUF2179 family)